MTLTIEEAAMNLSALIEKAAQNREDIVLTRHDSAVATLRPTVLSFPLPKNTFRKRAPGTAKGLVIVPPDFDAPLNDFADYQ